jgi:hypothetical protein
MASSRRLIDLPVAVGFAPGAPALNFKRRQAIDFTDNGKQWSTQRHSIVKANLSMNEVLNGYASF